MITTRCLYPFGAEIGDVDIARLAATPIDRIIDQIARHRVVVLREQRADDHAFVAFLARLGPLMFTAGEQPVAAAPDLNIVSNVGRVVPPRSVFHTDTSYIAQPPALTALRAVSLPAAGGFTLFSDQAQAAALLPSRVTQWLRHRTLLHSTKAPDGGVHEARHPVLRRHPLTGETTLFLSTPARCSGLSGVDAQTSARIVALLYRRSIRPAGLYRHHWRDGDIVVWDNRTTLHRADHDGVVGNRVLHRGLVQGEVPLAA